MSSIRSVFSVKRVSRLVKSVGMASRDLPRDFDLLERNMVGVKWTVCTVEMCGGGRVGISGIATRSAVECKMPYVEVLVDCVACGWVWVCRYV